MTLPEIEEFMRVCNSLSILPKPPALLNLTTLKILYVGNATYPLSYTLIKLALLF